MKSAVLIFACVALTGCQLSRKPTVQTVVAPAGPATAQLSSDVTAHIAKTEAQVAASTAALSKVSASAGAIHTINAGQPVGPRTDGVENEAKLIQTVAGEPSVADRLAASERARIVAEGKAAEIAKAYATAQAAAAMSAKELTKAKTALTESNEALSKSQAAAAVEQATQAEKLQAVIDAAKKEADARVAKIQDEARKSWMNKINYVLLGLGALFILAAVANAFLTNGLGLAKSGILAAGAALCFGLDYALNAPWFNYVAIGASVLTVLGVAAWAVIEWKQHKDAKTAVTVGDTAKKIVAVLDSTYDDATTEAKAVLDPVFDKLSKEMDGAEKDAVKLLRYQATATKPETKVTT